MRRLLAVFISFIALCTATAPAWAQRVRVVTTFSVLADIVRNVGGDAVELTNLVGPNADAHVYEPTPADARAMARAQVVIVNGLGFEGWLDRLIAASGYRGEVLVASKSITPRMLGDHPDPHAWQNLANGQIYVSNIQRALIKAAPLYASAIRQRGERYTAALQALEQEVRDAFAKLAPEARRVVTSHDAFGYFGAAYGIEFVAPQGWSTESEASARDVARIVQQIRTQRVRALFVENITDARLIKRIQAEAGGVIGATLYSDALSAPGTSADTYIKMFRHNAQALSAALRANPLVSR